jgi:hypothetical protein
MSEAFILEVIGRPRDVVRLMAEKFEVGVNEEHVMIVNYDFFMKRIKIELDGETKVSEFHPSPFAKKFQFDVGTFETHKVEVSVGAFSTKVLVDGKPAPPHPV